MYFPSRIHLFRTSIRKTIFSSLSKSLSNNSSSQNYFGFQPVSDEEKREKVYNVFTNVAHNYDLMNDVMSLGIHRFWKKHFIERLDPYRGTRLLDVAGGTGDVAFEFLRYVHEKHDEQSSVVVCDINQQMLEVGRKRATEMAVEASRCQWVCGDAMALPFEDNSFDAYTIAFGIRNVVRPEKAVREACRVLKPGGIFLCLEFSQVNNLLLRSFYDWYSFQIIPVLGEVISKDWKSYQYLVESIRKFPDQESFKQIIEASGFTLVNYENLYSGITAIHTGYKPMQ